jgi:hypothetical protein
VTTTGRILGRVTDIGRPLQGAQVRLVSRIEAGLLRVTSTDQRGEYRFKELPTGTYDVEVEADGFRLGAKPGVEVKAPFQNIVDVMLLRSGATPLGQQVAPLLAGAPGQGIPGSGTPSSGLVAEPALPPVKVHGALVDGDRHPVVDVSVLLVALQGTRLYQAVSGTDGGFTIEGVAPGRYRAVIRSPGHMPVDLKSVEVHPEAGLTLNMSLVDFPLNFKERAEGSPPPELPRPLPGMLPPAQQTAAPPSSSTPPPAAPPPETTEPIEKKAPSSAPPPPAPPAGNPPPKPPPGS